MEYHNTELTSQIHGEYYYNNNIINFTDDQYKNILQLLNNKFDIADKINLESNIGWGKSYETIIDQVLIKLSTKRILISQIDDEWYLVAILRPIETIDISAEKTNVVYKFLEKLKKENNSTVYPLVTYTDRYYKCDGIGGLMKLLESEII